MTGIDVPDSVNRFIAVCRDGKAFYEDAAGRVNDATLKEIFREMAKIRDDAIERLASYIEVRDAQVTESGTVAGATHQFLAKVQASLASDEAKVLVPQLVEAENRWLGELEEIAEEPLPDPVRQEVDDCLRNFRSTRDLIAKLNETAV